MSVAGYKQQVYVDRSFSFNMFKKENHSTQEDRTVLLAAIWADLGKGVKT